MSDDLKKLLKKYGRNKKENANEKLKKWLNHKPQKSCNNNARYIEKWRKIIDDEENKKGFNEKCNTCKYWYEMRGCANENMILKPILPFHNACNFYKEKKKSKYKNKKAMVDNIVFDSKKEAEYYQELLLLKKAGEITNIELQPVFVLQEGFISGGVRYRPITYKSDFRVTYAAGNIEIIDVKGMKTNVYKIKKKMLLYKFPGIIFKEV